ncbi:unnamed protein product [marine sediment metagenome]|uniref:Uncharacterized protein n=1 Tax=marine sediment metagenome TaxID=412755 RepID=X1NYL6_9ZZZZ
MKGISHLRQPVEKTASFTFVVSENPLADFDVEITSPSIPESFFPIVETNAVGGWESYKDPNVWIKGLLESTKIK